MKLAIVITLFVSVMFIYMSSKWDVSIRQVKSLTAQNEQLKAGMELLRWHIQNKCIDELELAGCNLVVKDLEKQLERCEQRLKWNRK